MQKLMIIRSFSIEYNKIENMINNLIADGAEIQSINPIIIHSHTNNTNFVTDVEMLTYVLYKEKGKENEE